MKATDAFKIILEKCGFTDVVITEVKLPHHIIDWAKGDDLEITDDEVAETIPYYRVKTSQGSFGIAMAVYNLIDVKDTGFNAMDLDERDANEKFYIVSLNLKTLGKLHHLMSRRKKS